MLENTNVILDCLSRFEDLHNFQILFVNSSAFFVNPVQKYSQAENNFINQLSHFSTHFNILHSQYLLAMNYAHWSIICLLTCNKYKGSSEMFVMWFIECHLENTPINHKFHQHLTPNTPYP